MDVTVLWSKFLDTIKNEMSSLAYQTWFMNTSLYRLNDNIALVIVPMQLHKKMLNDNYISLIKEKFNEVSGSIYEFNFLIKEEVEELEETKKKESNNLIIDKSNNETSLIQSNLNPKYTFETFIVGNSNRFAQAASLAVAQNPGKMYNPLFIYGNSGLGKTHLMHSIGNYIIDNSDRKVLYVTSEQFTNDLFGLSRKKNNDNNFNYIDFFKNKYRNIDVLIIDDIQFLGGATQSQQEFFHTFNSLYDNNKQIIISSDRSPNDLKVLEERLRTRFCWGLSVDIHPPEFELRIAILKKRIMNSSIEKQIPNDVIEYIATNVGSDIRQLEGSINRLLAYSTMMGGAKINLDLAIEALQEYISKGITDKDDIRRIQRIVAEYFNITVEDIRSKKRSANIAFPRQIAMYLCRKLTTESFPRIGIEFGGKDHSTVIHSVDKIEDDIANNKELANVIDKLTIDIR